MIQKESHKWKTVVAAGLQPSGLRSHQLRPRTRLRPKIADPDNAPRDQRSPAGDDTVVCRRCRLVITAVGERRVINGAHAHTFANPEGIVFEIVCYREAWGCGTVGPASSEFTWFAGYEWRIAVCLNCLTHLGWRFSSTQDPFFHGLIADRLLVRDP